MTSKPLVSIIVPCYNAEKFVETCVNSVVSQTYKNWECILINDGSNDKTLDLIRKFESQDKRIRVLNHENLGPSAARNKGIDNANGELIFFLDADDILINNTITTLVSSYNNNDIIIGATMTFSLCNEKIIKGSYLYYPKEGNISFKNENNEVLIRTMESGITPVPHNKLYRKDFINKYQLRFKFGILHEDELWFFETMLFARNVKFIDTETYLYRINNQGSITKNMNDKNLNSYIQIMYHIVTKYSKHKNFGVIAKWYAVYIKKILLDFAIRDRAKLSDEIISKLELALKDCYLPLGKDHILSKNNDIYYKKINQLSLQKFSIIEKYFFRNPINSVRKVVKVIKISYFLK